MNIGSIPTSHSSDCIADEQCIVLDGDDDDDDLDIVADECEHPFIGRS